MNDDPRYILKTETLDKGKEYRQLLLEAAPSGGFQVGVLEGVPGYHHTKYRETFATREEAERALERCKVDALNAGFKPQLFALRQIGVTHSGS